MKKSKVIFCVITLCVMLTASVFPAQAEEYSETPYYITGYHVDINVSEDNVLSIREEIDVYFNEERHGIFRTIPQKNEVLRADGSTAATRAKIKVTSCSDTYESYTQNGNLVLQIGDEDETIIGYKQYMLSYDYALGQDVADGYDELYFNIIGAGWDTYIENVSFLITMPKEFDASLLGFSTGGYGFSGSDIVIYDTDGFAISGFLQERLEPYQALTVRLELEEGYFYFNHTLHMLKLSTMVLIPLACLIFAVYARIKYGGNKKVVEVVSFYPPEGMNSTDVAYWYKGRLQSKKIIALLLELANEGYVAIHDDDAGGKDKNREYTIERIRTYPSELNEEKSLFFNGLFESGKDSVTAEDLKNKFYKTLGKIRSIYSASEKKGRINTQVSDQMQFVCWMLPILAFFVNILIFVNVMGGDERRLPFGIGAVILAAVYWTARYIPRRTEESHRNLEKIAGFRKFLATAEKSRLEALVQENPKYFYNILPFAYALDVTDKWVNKFEDIAIEPPEWYSGHNVFTPVAMWRTMDRTLNSAARVMVSSPGRSSSGGGSGGGGGVSGGGSGGGGGGSW